MNTKIVGILVLIVALAGGWYFFSSPDPKAPEGEVPATSISGTSVVPVGTYTVEASQSTFTWSAKKPLIEGYIDSGTISVTTGAITVGTTTANGSFTIDMNTLRVGLTAKKPGKEGALEKHLKSDDFFDVAKYPTATFLIKQVGETASSSTEFIYTIRGDLTMKGKTNEISFPAEIYFKDGMLHAKASFEIDRTKWGLTYGSGNFFQNLGDKMIDDMVALSFHVLATPLEAATNGATDVFF